MRRALLFPLVLISLISLAVAGCSTSSVTGSAGTKAWYDQVFGTLNTISKSGSGNGEVVLNANIYGAIVHAKHDGDGKFTVEGIDSTGEVVDPLLDTTGAFTGDLGLGVNAWGRVATLRITAEGKWSVSVKAMRTASKPKFPTSGTGYAVIKWEGGESSLHLTYQGSGTFVVTQYYSGEMPNQLANAQGATSFTVTSQTQAGPSVVVIQADGPWTIG